MPCSREDFSDMAEEPARERLFDVLMRRLEVLAPHREAVRSLLRSARAQPAAGFGAQRAGGALAAMDADRRRDQRLGSARHDPRARAWRCCSARCCAPGCDDDDPGLARTMAALDRALARGQRVFGFLDDLCSIPSRLCRLRPRRRRAATTMPRRSGRGLIRPSRNLPRPGFVDPTRRCIHKLKLRISLNRCDFH